MRGVATREHVEARLFVCRLHITQTAGLCSLLLLFPQTFAEQNFARVLLKKRF